MLFINHFIDIELYNKKREREENSDKNNSTNDETIP